MSTSNLLLALKSTGTCWAWGNGAVGQLGNNDEVDKSSPVSVVGGHAFSAVCAGMSISSALKSNGECWAWGDGVDGACGDNTTNRRSSPVLVVGGHLFIQITAGERSIMGLKANGEVWGWGLNQLYGNLGDNTKTNRSSPVLVVGNHAFTSISSGEDHTLGLKSNGECWGWGWNDFGEIGNFLSDPNTLSAADKSSPVSVVGNHSFIYISTGAYHSLALKVNGECWAWGYNNGGQLGSNTQYFYTTNPPTSLNMGDLWQDQDDEQWYRAACIGADQITAGEWEAITNPTSSSSSPILVVGGHSFINVVGGGSHSLGLKSNGQCWAWGYNGLGSLGNNTTDSTTSPIQVIGEHIFSKITATAGNSYGLKMNGEIWAWGYGWYGGIGDGTQDTKSSPVLVVGNHSFDTFSDFYGTEVSISSSSSCRSSSSSCRSSSSSSCRSSSSSSSSSSCRSSSSSSSCRSSSSSSRNMTTTISTYNKILYASILKIESVPIANVKTINGV